MRTAGAFARHDIHDASGPWGVLALLGLLVLSLAGCAPSGGDTAPPSVQQSAASTPAPTPSPSVEVASQASAQDQPGEPPVTELVDSGSDGVASAEAASSPKVSVQLNWTVSSDQHIERYLVYYGRSPSSESGLCQYEDTQAVDIPPAIISGLEPDTVYFFAISAYNESESPCSEEFQMKTPSVQS